MTTPTNQPSFNPEFPVWTTGSYRVHDLLAGRQEILRPTAVPGWVEAFQQPVLAVQRIAPTRCSQDARRATESTALAEASCTLLFRPLSFESAFARKQTLRHPRNGSRIAPRQSPRTGQCLRHPCSSPKSTATGLRHRGSTRGPRPSCCGTRSARTHARTVDGMGWITRKCFSALFPCGAIQNLPQALGGEVCFDGCILARNEAVKGEGVGTVGIRPESARLNSREVIQNAYVLGVQRKRS